MCAPSSFDNNNQQHPLMSNILGERLLLICVSAHIFILKGMVIRLIVIHATTRNQTSIECRNHKNLFSITIYIYHNLSSHRWNHGLCSPVCQLQWTDWLFKVWCKENKTTITLDIPYKYFTFSWEFWVSACLLLSI